MTLEYRGATAAQTAQRKLAKAGIPSRLQKRFHPNHGCFYTLTLPDAQADAARHILQKEKASQ